MGIFLYVGVWYMGLGMTIRLRVPLYVKAYSDSILIYLYVASYLSVYMSIFIYLYLVLIKNKLASRWEPAIKFVSLWYNKEDKNMTKVINTIQDIMTVNILDQYKRGEFRHIVKTRLGMTCVDARDFDNVRMNEHPESIISGYKRGALQTVQFKAEGSDVWLTVFSRTGKKVKLMDEAIMRDLTVGTINSKFDNTNLMDQNQYRAVNSKTWADKAFVINENKVGELVAS